MSITYDPKRMLRKIAPERKIEKILSGNVSVKRTALSFVGDIEFLDKKKVLDTALKVVRNYKKRIKDDSTQRSEILDDPKLLIQRVENEVVHQVAEKIEEKYEGDYFIWLPSDAEEPDPEHQLKYGKKYRIGFDELPGERPGCRCGMEILTSDTELDL